MMVSTPFLYCKEAFSTSMFTRTTIILLKIFTFNSTFPLMTLSDTSSFVAVGSSR